MSVAQEMMQRKAALEMEYGEQPLGFLLGPDQYLSLCEELVCLKMYHPEVSFLNITEYAGIPVWNKQTNGVELLISQDLTLKILGRKVLNRSK